MSERKEKLILDNQIVVFIGPEGAGKTTIAKRLAEESGSPRIATGDIIRDLAANDLGPLGEECRQMFQNDTYLSGETLMAILSNRLGMPDTQNGFILDGGLRTLDETVGFKSMLESVDRGLPLTVIYLNIPKEISFERLVSGENARKRDHDTEDGVANRLAMFYAELERRLAEINKHGWTIVEVDATKTPEEVYSTVVSQLMPR